MPTLRAAGYQGPASILSRAMATLCHDLSRAAPLLTMNWTPNVTAQGESAAALFQSVETGERQLCYMASGYLSERVPELSILDVPFTVTDRAKALALLDGEAGAWLRRAVESRTAYQVLGFWDNGFRHVSNALRPLRGPEDVQGMRIRTLDSALYRQSLQAMGFQAMTSDVKELVAWVRHGQVDAQENPLTNFLGFELWRHHPHVSLTSHFWGVLLLLCPQDWYRQLSADSRQHLQSCVTHATALQRQWAAEEDQAALAKLHTLNVQVVQAPALQLQAFKACVAPVGKAVLAQLPAALVKCYIEAL